MPWPMLYYPKRPSWIRGQGEATETARVATAGGRTIFRVNHFRRHEDANPFREHCHQYKLKLHNLQLVAGKFAKTKSGTKRFAYAVPGS